MGVMRRGILASLVLTVVVCCTGRPRSDTWMREHLSHHRADFDRLVRMSAEDYRARGVIRIAHDFTRLEKNWAWPRPEEDWGITKARWDEYRALFRTLQLPSGLERAGEGFQHVQLMVYGVGLASEGKEYGYLWSPTPPEPISDTSREFTAKPFEGNWYRYEWVVY